MAKSTVTIMAFDPGLASCGWSVLQYELTTGHTTVLKCGTITGRSLLKIEPDMQKQFEKRHIILWKLEARLTEMFETHMPDYVVAEDAFMHRFVLAYAALVLVVQTIRTATMRTLNRPLFLIAPRESKKAISADGGADKSTVQEAILRNPAISFRSNKFDEYTEHTYDSIAAGIAFITNHLPILLSAPKITM